MGYITPAVWGCIQGFAEGDKMGSGQPMCGLATSPLLFGVSSTLHSGGQSEIWAINGRIGYIIPMVWEGGDPLECGTKLDVATKWED